MFSVFSLIIFFTLSADTASFQRMLLFSSLMPTIFVHDGFLHFISFRVIDKLPIFASSFLHFRQQIFSSFISLPFHYFRFSFSLLRQAFHADAITPQRRR